MSVRLIILTSITLLLLLGANAEAKMYRWVDENGITVYSQTPPESGNATEINVAPPPRPAEPAEPAEPAATDTPPAATTADTPDEDEELARKKAESEKIKADNCSAAKHNLSTYQNLGNRLIKNPNGLYERLNDEEREKRIQQAKDQIQEFCSE